MSPYLMRTCSTIPSLPFGRLLFGMLDHSVFSALGSRYWQLNRAGILMSSAFLLLLTSARLSFTSIMCSPDSRGSYRATPEIDVQLGYFPGTGNKGVMCRFVHFSGGLQTLSTDMVENLPGTPTDQNSARNKRRCPAPS